MFTLGVMQQQLEQLERLCSEITTPHPHPPPPPHYYPHYWVILDLKSKQDKVKVTNLKNLPKVQIFQIWKFFFTCETPSEVAWQDVSGGTIPENHESIIEPLIELSIDHRNTEVL